MKMKEFGPRGGVRIPGTSLDPPMLELPVVHRCLHYDSCDVQIDLFQ